MKLLSFFIKSSVIAGISILALKYVMKQEPNPVMISEESSFRSSKNFRQTASALSSTTAHKKSSSPLPRDKTAEAEALDDQNASVENPQQEDASSQDVTVNQVELNPNSDTRNTPATNFEDASFSPSSDGFTVNENIPKQNTRKKTDSSPYFSPPTVSSEETQVVKKPAPQSRISSSSATSTQGSIPAPIIAMAFGSTTPGEDSTPNFSITLTGGAAFSDADTVTLYFGGDDTCNGTLVDTQTISGGATTSVNLSSTTALTSFGIADYYVKVSNLTGNSTCTTTAFNYDYRPSAPTTLALQPPLVSPNNVATPTITVSGGGVINGSFVRLFSDSTCTSAISTSTASTGTSVDITTTTLPEGSYLIYANVTINSQASTCSPVVSALVYDLDLTGVGTPGIDFDPMLTSPGTDSTPTFIVTLEGGGTFQSSDKIRLYNQAACAGSSVALVTGVTTNSTPIEASPQTNGTSVTYSVKVTDLAGNDTCSNAHSNVSLRSKTYVLDTTAPVVPLITLSSGFSSPDTEASPSFSITLTGLINFTDADVITLYEGGNSTCNGTARGTATISGNSASSVDLVTNSPILNFGTTQFYTKVTDQAGNSTCSSSSFAYTYRPTPPASITLTTPSSAVSNNPTPTFTVSGGSVSNGALVTLYSDSSCSTNIGDSSATTTSVDVITDNLSAQAYLVYSTVTMNSTISGCSVVAAPYLLDLTAPAAPAIGYDILTVTPSTDPTPTFSITLTGGGNFSATDAIDLYRQASCGGGSIVDSSGVTTSTATINASSQSEGSSTYSASVTDEAGNTTCSSSHATLGSRSKTYFYDNTIPTWTNSISHAATHTLTTETPSISYTSNASDGAGSGVASYQYAIGTGTSGGSINDIKDWSTAPNSPFQVSSGLSLTTGTTYYINMRATDNVGLESAINSSTGWTPVVSLSVVARYSNAPNWMDYIKSSDGTTACAGSETYYSDCIQGGQYRKVDVNFESDCTGLSMTDLRNAFDWTCVDNGATITFNGQLKANKGLRDLINFDNDSNPTFLSESVTLSGCTQCPLTSTATTWWSNSISPLPNNSAGSAMVLDGTDDDGAGIDRSYSAGTIFTLANSRSTKGFSLNRDKLAVVADSGVTLTYNGSTSICSYKSILCSDKNYLWVEVDTFDGASSTDRVLHFTTATKFSNIRSMTINNPGVAGFYFNGSTSVIKNITVNGPTTHPTTPGWADAPIRLAGSWNYAGDLIAYNVGKDGGGQSIQIGCTTCSGNSIGNYYINGSYYGWYNGGQAGSDIEIRGDINISDTASYGLYLHTATRYNFKGHINISKSAGLFLTSTKYSKFKSMSITNVTTNSPLYLDAATKYNTFGPVLIANINGSYYPSIGGSYNAFAGGLTLANSTYSSYSTHSSTIFLSYMSLNTRWGIYLTGSSDNMFVNLAKGHNDYGFWIGSTSNRNIMSGNFLAGNNATKTCQVDAGSTMPGLINTTCTDSGTNGSNTYSGQYSDATYLTGKNFTSSIVGKISSDDASNSSDSSGSQAFSSITDWSHFENTMRGWGFDGAAFPASTQRVNCSTGTCRLWDFSISRNDSVILNKSGNGSNINNGSSLTTNGTLEEIIGDSVGNEDGICDSNELCKNSFAAGVACPVQVNGSEAVYGPTYTYDTNFTGGYNGIQVVENNAASGGNDDGICDAGEVCIPGGDLVCDSGDKCQQRFLKFAHELIFDSGGDGDGLCESNEDCMYMPNIGAYQGHGNVIGPCVFSDNGGLTGIEIYGYEYNGR